MEYTIGKRFGNVIIFQKVQQELKKSRVLKDVIDYKRCFKSGRMLRSGEIGCFLSHLEVWKHMIENNISYAIVLEDDSIIDKHFFKLIHDIIF